MTGAPPERAGTSFLALGDSYTVGEQVDRTACWPVQLAQMLRDSGVALGDPRIIAQTGWTTDELASAIARARPEGPYDLVSLLIGVNNQYRGRDAENYRVEFGALLGQAVGFAGDRAARVLVLSIPDWGVTPFAEGRDRGRIAAAIDQFNGIGRDETTRTGATWVDITPTSRAMHDGWLAPDGLHPSGAQYGVWAQLALEPARIALRSR